MNSATNASGEMLENAGLPTFKLSIMFLETAVCMALNGTVVPLSSETEVPAEAAAAGAGAGEAGLAAAAAAGVAPLDETGAGAETEGLAEGEAALEDS